MPDPDNLPPGKVLLIPGLEDLQGEIKRSAMPLGETMRSLMGLYGMPLELFQRLNFVTAPDGLMVGRQFLYLVPGELLQTRLQLTAGLTALEVAVYGSASPWLTSQYNHTAAPWRLLANDTLFLPGAQRGALAALLPLATDIMVDQIAQGKTSVFTAQVADGIVLSGELLGFPLHFFPNLNSPGYTALQGVPRLSDPGVISLILNASTPDGRVFTQQQHAYLQPKNYGFDAPLEVLDSTVDPAITEPKDRERVYGHVDQKRLYGNDYTQMLESTGFQVERIPYLDRFSEEEARRFGFAQHGGVADLTESDGAERGDGHQRADSDAALGQSLHGWGHKRRGAHR